MEFSSNIVLMLGKLFLNL